MAPEDRPADDDEHGECRHEIERLDGLLSDARVETRKLVLIYLFHNFHEKTRCLTLST